MVKASVSEMVKASVSEMVMVKASVSEMVMVKASISEMVMVKASQFSYSLRTTAFALLISEWHPIYSCHMHTHL